MNSLSSKKLLLALLLLPLTLFPTCFRCGDGMKAIVAPQVASLKLDVDGIGVLRGTMIGAYGELSYKKMCGISVNANINYVLGNVKSFQDMDRYIHDVEGKLTVGYTVPPFIWKCMMFTPYFGLGYDYTVQQIRADLSLDAQKFHYYDYFIPLGLAIEIKPYSFFGFGLLVEWDPQINSRAKLQGQPGIKWSLARKAGYLVEVPFNFFLRPRKKFMMEFSIVPYLRRMVDGKLDARLLTGDQLTLPKQTYKFWGGRLDITANF